MTRYQLLFFRFLLFIAGGGVILLAFFLLRGGRELTRYSAFVWISIGVMYLVIALPFFFSVFKASGFSGRIPSRILIWYAIPLYLAASLAIILLISLPIFSLYLAIVAQAVLVFLLFVVIHLAYFSSSHVRNVAAKEGGKLHYIRQIKSKAQALSLSADRLPADYEDAQRTLRRTLEDIKYIYPVNRDAGSDLEQKILRSLDMLSELSDNIQSGAHTVALEREAVNLQMLVKERKLLRN